MSSIWLNRSEITAKKEKTVIFEIAKKKLQMIELEILEIRDFFQLPEELDRFFDKTNYSTSKILQDERNLVFVALTI